LATHSASFDLSHPTQEEDETENIAGPREAAAFVPGTLLITSTKVCVLRDSHYLFLTPYRIFE
jgi:hypothetical protein